MSLSLPGNDRFLKRGLRGLWALFCELLALALIVLIIAAGAAMVWFAFARDADAASRCASAGGSLVELKTGGVACLRREATVPIGGQP